MEKQQSTITELREASLASRIKSPVVSPPLPLLGGEGESKPLAYENELACSPLNTSSSLCSLTLIFPA